MFQKAKPPPPPPLKHEIKHDLESNTTAITNVRLVTVNDPTMVHDLLRTASKNRACASTRCNEHSSRSHSLFTLNLTGCRSTAPCMETRSSLTLVDLAGSERLDNTRSVQTRLQETQHINRSLACLGDVIAAINAKKPHIPFRNSKLTYLLQNCLGGSCKSLMFVNISPLDENLAETLCSLRFATKVNNSSIGPARQMVVSDNK